MNGIPKQYELYFYKERFTKVNVYKVMIEFI